MSLKIQTALLPQKHIDFSQSTVGLAGQIRKVVAARPKRFDEIWSDVTDAKEWPAKVGTQQILHALILLFAIGQLVLEEDGKVRLTT